MDKELNNGQSIVRHVLNEIKKHAFGSQTLRNEDVTGLLNGKRKRGEIQKEIENSGTSFFNNNEEQNYENNEKRYQRLINTIRTTHDHFLNQYLAHRLRTP